MKKILVILALVISGCVQTENRSIEMKTTDIAAANSNTWWTTPYYAQDKGGGPWDMFVAPTQLDPLDLEMEFFESNTLKWPKTMPPARPMFKPLPKPEPKKTEDATTSELY